MKSDSVNFTDDLIEGFCRQSGTDIVQMKRMYEFYSKALSTKLKTRPEVIEAPIKGLGVFFISLHGISINIRRKKAVVEEFQKGHAKYDFYIQQKEHIRNRIKKCQECGISNVRFLHTFITKKKIKNGG